MPLTPELAKWRESQLQAMLALGDSPQDAERVLAAMERLSPDDPTRLPDPEAFSAAMSTITPDDIRDAMADWMVRARPEWKRLLTATMKATAAVAQEFNPHHDQLGRFAPGGEAVTVGISHHALSRIGKQGRANVTSVREALEHLQTVKTPAGDWSYPVKQGDRLRGHLIGTDGVVKTVVGAWYKAEKLPPALAEFNPYHDTLGRFATGGGAMAADTGGGGGGGNKSIPTDVMKRSVSTIPTGTVLTKDALSSDFQDGTDRQFIAKMAIAGTLDKVYTVLTLPSQEPGKIDAVIKVGKDYDAPENLHVYDLASVVKGGGTRLMAEACRMAAKSNKGITLESLDDSKGFYRKLKMHPYSVKGKPHYRFSAEEAASFADRVLGAA